VLAGERITRQEIAAMGYGGLHRWLVLGARWETAVRFDDGESEPGRFACHYLCGFVSDECRVAGVWPSLL